MRPDTHGWSHPEGHHLYRTLTRKVPAAEHKRRAVRYRSDPPIHATTLCSTRKRAVSEQRRSPSACSGTGSALKQAAPDPLQPHHPKHSVHTGACMHSQRHLERNCLARPCLFLLLFLHVQNLMFSYERHHSFTPHDGQAVDQSVRCSLFSFFRSVQSWKKNPKQ